MDEMDLHSLFHAAGYERAPDGLRVAVMDQVLAQGPLSAFKPLISRRAWIMAVTLLIASVALSWAFARHAQGSPASGFTPPFEVDLATIGQDLHHATWVSVAMGLALVLTLVDRSLARAHPRSAH